jgi:purine-cytosine permease-like protein
MEGIMDRSKITLIFMIIAGIAVVISAISMFVGSFEQNLIFMFGGTTLVFVVLLTIFFLGRKKRD